MRHSLRTGLSFGLTSGVITTLGLMVGLHSGSRSASVVLRHPHHCGGGLPVGCLGYSGGGRVKWEATLATFAAKFIITGTFVLPVLFLGLDAAMWARIGWGLSCSRSSASGRRVQSIEPWKVILSMYPSGSR